MKNKIAVTLLALSSFILMPISVHANPQDLGTCFIDSLTGKERKVLIKWIFLSMAVHPELESYTTFSKVVADTSDKAVGAIITRLFTEDCPTEAKAAQKADPIAINKAFELVGQVAMQELMTNENVIAALSNYGNYTDQSKISALFVE